MMKNRIRVLEFMNYLISLLLVSFAINCSAADIELDLKTMDATLEKIAVHARDYPPKFSSAAERKQTVKDLKAAIKILDAAVAQYPKDPDLLFRDGYANAMGQHLDISGCDDKFISSFEQFLKLKPNDKKGNFYYGAFLASTATRQKDSIPYLNKAIELGESDAHYTLAFVYILQQNKEKAIEHLRQYAKAYPEESAAINEKINQINEAKFRVHHGPPPNK